MSVVLLLTTLLPPGALPRGGTGAEWLAGRPRREWMESQGSYFSPRGDELSIGNSHPENQTMKK
jgi:hypothetical protein